MTRSFVKDTDGAIVVQLTRGYTATIDACDIDLTDLNWVAGVQKKFGIVYAIRTFRSEDNSRRAHEQMHRIILQRALGRPLLLSELVDHKDTNTLNNRRSNLRIATVSQNTQNQRKRSNCTSPYKGVTWNKSCQKWQAAIKYHGKSIYLGVFDDPLEAHKRYCEKATELFGEFARAA